jgi:hypothetical protein
MEKHGILGIAGFMVLPDLYLIMMTNLNLALIDLVFLMFSASTTTLYYCTVRYGLHQRNFYLVLGLMLRVVLEWAFNLIIIPRRIRQSVEAQQANQSVNINELDVDRLERILNSIGSMASFNEMSLKLEKLQQFFTMLQDTSKIKQFNVVQLLTAQRDLGSALDSINGELNERNESTSNYFFTGTASEKCVVCFENGNPNVLFSPCNHQCVCTDCMESVLEKESLGHCFLCKIPVISWTVQSDFELLNYIDEDDYKVEASDYTFKQLYDLKKYVENNPNEKKKLRDPNVFN